MISSDRLRPHPSASLEWQEVHSVVNANKSVVYAPDVIDAILMVMMKGPDNTVYNVADDTAVTLVDLLKRIGNALGEGSVNID